MSCDHEMAVKLGLVDVSPEAIKTAVPAPPSFALKVACAQVWGYTPPLVRATAYDLITASQRRYDSHYGETK